MLALFLRLLQKPRLYAESDWLALLALNILTAKHTNLLTLSESG
jgi:hypothetical protein